MGCAGVVIRLCTTDANKRAWISTKGLGVHMVMTNTTVCAHALATSPQTAVDYMIRFTRQISAVTLCLLAWPPIKHVHSKELSAAHEMFPLLSFGERSRPSC